MPQTPRGLDRLDLNLISALVVLIEERSTTKAARRLHLAQSTVSGILARLRDIFGDELLIRQGRGLVPTARAEELLAAAKPHLDALTAALGEARDFHPEADARIFRLGCTDAVAMGLLPTLIQTLREDAPNCHLTVRVGDYRSLPGMLSSGEITTAVGFLRDDPAATAKIRVLRHAEWVVLRDPDTPPVNSLSDFCTRPHALVTPLGDLSGLVDDQLRAQGRRRDVRLGLSSFALLLASLPGTDLVATVPDFAAVSLARLGRLAIDPAPLDIPRVTNAMAWSAATDRDPAERWFRDRVAANFPSER
ncbi:MAG: LysR family transcriptional regulator [Pseudomonadota bacterium]